MTDVAVVTIHGTFAREATWVNKNSAICKAIVTAFSTINLTCHIHPYRWSGQNTINARRKASIGLKQHIRSLKNSSKYGKIYVVSHSHGSTVAVIVKIDARFTTLSGSLIPVIFGPDLASRCSVASSCV